MIEITKATPLMAEVFQIYSIQKYKSNCYCHLNCNSFFQFIILFVVLCVRLFHSTPMFKRLVIIHYTDMKTYVYSKYFVNSKVFLLESVIFTNKG